MAVRGNFPSMKRLMNGPLVTRSSHLSITLLFTPSTKALASPGLILTPSLGAKLLIACFWLVLFCFPSGTLANVILRRQPNSICQRNGYNARCFSVYRMTVRRILPVTIQPLHRGKTSCCLRSVELVDKTAVIDPPEKMEIPDA